MYVAFPFLVTFLAVLYAGAEIAWGWALWLSDFTVVILLGIMQGALGTRFVLLPYSSSTGRRYAWEGRSDGRFRAPSRHHTIDIT